MPNEATQTYVIADARTFDGDPFEVAERAAAQAAGAIKLATQAAAGAYIMARNAEMERQLIATDECDAARAENEPAVRKQKALVTALEALATTQEQLIKAAAFNPRAALPRS